MKAHNGIVNLMEPLLCPHPRALPQGWQWRFRRARTCTVQKAHLTSKTRCSISAPASLTLLLCRRRPSEGSIRRQGRGEHTNERANERNTRKPSAARRVCVQKHEWHQFLRGESGGGDGPGAQTRRKLKNVKKALRCLRAFCVRCRRARVACIRRVLRGRKSGLCICSHLPVRARTYDKCAVKAAYHKVACTISVYLRLHSPHTTVLVCTLSARIITCPRLDVGIVELMLGVLLHVLQRHR